MAGWFSFEAMGASAGDLLARDRVCEWLRDAGFAYDVAAAPPFEGGVAWRECEPNDYSPVVFVCGPFGNGPPVDEFLRHFADRPLVGVNLTMLDSLEAWNPFELLLERDSSRAVRPDLAFLAPPPAAPLVGLVRIDAQPEYGERSRIRFADDAIDRLVAARDLVTVAIDTRLDVNRAGLRTAAQIEALIARTDAVITTRLHGLVLALKNGVPAVAIDTVAGGAKLSRQAGAVGWPYCLPVDDLSDAKLAAAFEHCLTDAARSEAAAAGRRARERLAGVAAAFHRYLQGL